MTTANLPSMEQAIAEAEGFRDALSKTVGTETLGGLIQYSLEAIAAGLIAQMHPTGREVFLRRIRDFYPPIPTDMSAMAQSGASKKVP